MAREKKKMTTDYSGLSNRAIGCLSRAGIKNRNEAIDAFNNGRLHIKGGAFAIRNYGKKTHKEVMAWCGINNQNQKHEHRS